MSVLSTGTVTFLFTDVEGSTRLLKQLGRARYGEVIAQQQRLLREVFAANRGEEVDTQGDSFFVAFRSASDAVSAAVAAQRAFATHDWPNGAEVHVRIGIHTGEAVATGERYLGLSVHRAARVGAVAYGGQVLLSSSTRELVEDDMPEGVFLRDLGHVRLKDIDRPERIAQLAADGLRLEFPPLRGAEPVSPSPVSSPSVLRRRSLLAAMLAGVVAAAVAIPVFELGGGSGASVSLADSLLRIDPVGARVIGGVDIPGRPIGVTTCAATVFVATLDGTVSAIDPRTSKPYPIRVKGAPSDISHVGALAAVVTGPPTDTVTIIDGGSATISDVFALPGAPSAAATVAVYGGVVWIANPNAHELERVESPYTGIATGESVPLPPLVTGERASAGYAGIAAGGGALWVAGNDANHTVWRIDPATRLVTAIPLPFAPQAIAAGYGGTWVLDQRGDTVATIDWATNRLGQRIHVGLHPSAVAVGANFVWVANELGGTVSRIDPQQGRVKNVRVGRHPIGLAVGLGAVWVVSRPS
jgi:class 3 adenylate cyclase/DNA-binding beta-propeller fold protein YncE